MSIDWPSESDSSARVMEITAAGFPQPRHPAEADLFCRQTAVPGHDQAALEGEHVTVGGCGGLGSWFALGSARMGVKRLTLIDPDRFDRTNAPRQLIFEGDIGEFKSHALARNIAPHMTNAGVVRGVGHRMQEALDEHARDATLLLVGVDNNAARTHASRWARDKGIPAIFAMLSLDGLRAQVFLQEVDGPCLRCVLPDMSASGTSPCAAATIAGCFLTAAHVLAHVGRLARRREVAWRETSLDGSTERASAGTQRPGCGCDMLAGR